MDNPTADRARPGEPANPVADYDAEHGTPNSSIPKLSDEQAWGTSLNPVRETPPAGTGLK